MRSIGSLLGAGAAALFATACCVTPVINDGGVADSGIADAGSDAGMTPDAGCTPACAGKCTGASDGCGGYCPPPGSCAGCCDSTGTCQSGKTTAACGTAGGTCTKCPANQSCSDGACSTICNADCTGKCAGADDGCGGTCKTACAGCCDVNHLCQPGTTLPACGAGGNACQTCTANGVCQNGLCCAKTAAPACSTTPASDNCGGTYPATCTADGGEAPSCCGTQCCPIEACLGGTTCCPAGQEANGGNCCTPDCTNKCAGAQDGCGHPCPTNTCLGCCEADGGGCLLAMTDTECNSDGGACVACASPAYCGTPATGPGPDGGETFGPSQCCTPDCARKCAGAADGCGGTCPTNHCAGCCDGTTCVAVASEDGGMCGNGGAACQDCGGALCNSGACSACAPNATRTIPGCGTCGTEPQFCNSGGSWQSIPDGGCTNYAACSSGQCCDATSNTCQPGTQTGDCGASGTCQACNPSTQTCGAQECCPKPGTWVSQSTQPCFQTPMATCNGNHCCNNGQDCACHTSGNGGIFSCSTTCACCLPAGSGVGFTCNNNDCCNGCGCHLVCGPRGGPCLIVCECT